MATYVLGKKYHTPPSHTPNGHATATPRWLSLEPWYIWITSEDHAVRVISSHATRWDNVYNGPWKFVKWKGSSDPQNIQLGYWRIAQGKQQ